jgi:hypothetical protein
VSAGNVGRRSAAASGLAMIAFAGTAAMVSAGSVAPPEPDAELVALAAEFVRLQGLIDPLTRRFFQLPANHPDIMVLGQKEIALSAAQDEISYRMQDIPATTDIGLRAKAQVGRRLYLRYRKEEIMDASLNHEEHFVWAMINDMLGGSA